MDSSDLNHKDVFPLWQAVGMGDLSKFRRALYDNQEVFVQWGILLILEKLQLLTYRNLFRRV